MSADAWSAGAAWVQVVVSVVAVALAVVTVRGWLHEHRAVQRSQVATNVLVAAMAYLDALRRVSASDPLGTTHDTMPSLNDLSIVTRSLKRSSRRERVTDREATFLASYRAALAVLGDEETRALDVIFLVRDFRAELMAQYFVGLVPGVRAEQAPGTRPNYAEVVADPLLAEIDKATAAILAATRPIARLADKFADPPLDESIMRLLNRFPEDIAVPNSSATEKR